MQVQRNEKLADGRSYLMGLPENTCSHAMEVLIDKEGKIAEAVIHGGCMGNTQGVCNLIKGMEVQEVINRLEGIDCGGKGTSCPDQLSKLLKVWQEK